jgi:MraZ protein
MFTGFFGTSENSIDDKNRLIIPARFRNELGNRFMLTKGFDKCLYIYKMEDYEVLVNKIRKLPQSDRDVRKFIREFFSNTEECHLDSQGRILIPQHLRDYAGINKNLVTKGALDKIEIWSTEVLSDPEGENMMDNEEFVRKLDMYDL